MRITAGKYKNRKVLCPPGEIRPAMDRMRESLFSILESRLGSLYGLAFLDGFSGSGLVGIEAASRGASPIHLVERDRGKRTTILKNISYVEEDITLYSMDIKRYILSCTNQYDLIYLDPPFPMEKKEDVVALVDQQSLLKESGLLIIHHPHEESFPHLIGALNLIDMRKYGRSVLLFFQKYRQIKEPK